MLIINDLAMAYGPKLLFTDVNLKLNSGLRFGLVGANGAGKSTFLKVLTGEEEACLGEVTFVKNARVGWLKQDQFRYENTNVINVAIAGKQVLWQAMCEKEAILAKDEVSEADGYHLGELEQIIADNDGYTAEYVAGELLLGLGIAEEYHYQPLSVLSGGYKLRVLLAQSLFDNPDILLLDEPTNHLDIESIYWLEAYLRDQFKGVLIFISHDIAFINNVATHILDIDYGEVRQYTGNYNCFGAQKEAFMEQKLHEQTFMQKKIDRLQTIIDKFRAGTRAKQSQSKQKLVDKMEMPDIRKSSRISPHFNFKQKRMSGKNLLKVTGIFKSFADNAVLNNVGFNILRGEKVIIIGPNGVGKSTLLKILTGNLQADKGEFEFGHEVQYSYFAQDHHELLHESISAFKWLENEMMQIPTGAIRTVMGQMLFRQDEAHKNILALSGGEEARLLFAKIMMEEANLLILDEPTNHLDIEAKEALKQSLINYPGSLIMVTHDRDFASSIATRIIAITPKKIVDFKGTYQEYLDKFGQDYFKS